MGAAYLGVPCAVKNRPALDAAYLPFAPWRDAYLKEAHCPVRIAVERQEGQVAVFDTRLRGVTDPADLRFLERTVKLLLWSVGGWRVRICGCDGLTRRLADIYGSHGSRAFDASLMETVFRRPFTLESVAERDFPAARSGARKIGGHLSGCRIGFDAGGSDRKVSAVINGEMVYAEEVVWHPKTQPDPQYHYDGILSALRAAAAHLPRVDAIGVSSAGVILNDSPMVSSLFVQVPPEKHELVRTIYTRAAAALGNVPVAVANDGDVTALAGYMSLGTGPVMGIAMGTSQAAGYVDAQGRVSGWLNELAFAPVDLAEAAPRDPWSGDTGVGGQYFSQDAVIRLAAAAGVPTDAALPPAQQLRQVQELARQGHPAARRIFRDVGVCLAHTLALYAEIYPLRHVMVLGRVASGIGGEWMTETCRRVLAEEYPQLPLEVLLPDDRFRRIGQSVAAASLPQVRP
jgi:predicted NBD/HSP70 family sugar kinase